ncbi:MAG: 30S ribosomal protein S1, partial [bacterium]
MGEMNPTMLDPDNDDFDLEDEENKPEDTQTDRTDEETEDETDTATSEEQPTEEQASEEPPSEEETEIEEGAILEGEVVKTDDVEAYVDIGWQSEGILPYDQLREGSITEGQDITVKIVTMEGEDGLPVLSEKQALADLAWNRVKKYAANDQPVEGTVFKKIKGGFLVRLSGGLTAFMPMSHISLSKKKDHERYIDKTFEMKIIEFDRDEDNVVVSRKKHLEEQKEAEKKKFFDQHDEGDWVEGAVKNIVNFGAFINLGPVDGLLHISDIAWGQVRNVEDYFSQGDELEVKILSIDPDESKVSLGLKQKYPDPWEDIHENYEVGDVTTGEIVDVWDDGVFVRLEQHVEGKIDESELSWIESWNHPSDQFEEGEKIKVKITGIDEERRIISLSHKQITNNPWKILKERFPEETVLKAPVVDIHQDHINVQLLESVKGIIRRPDIS